MGFDLSSLIGGSIGDAFQKIVGTFKVSPEAKLEAQTKLAAIQLELQSKILDQIGAQIEVDKTEAANVNWFVAGWRPFVGWICGFGIAVQFVFAPLADWVSGLVGHPFVVPSLDLGTLMTLLLGMLGIGGMRTYEKIQGAQGNHQ